MPLTKSDRALIIIGGKEDREDEKLILKAVADRAKGGRLVVVTAATEKPELVFDKYEQIFRGLGVRHIYKLNIETREDAMSEKNVRILDDTVCIFFTGGDQLRITSHLGNSPVCRRIQEIYEEGGVIAGTSAGASVMTETMMVSGDGEQTHRLGGQLRLAPGLGLIQGLIVDQHFAERGRTSRLLAAVAMNPRILGVGIDENTAVIVERDRTFRVLGEGGVYIFDGANVSYSNVAEEQMDRALSLFDVKLHVLSQSDTFDCVTRAPKAHPADEIEEELLGKR